jgi:ADP-heptose:LPS heptosyltransferase
VPSKSAPKILCIKLRALGDSVLWTSSLSALKTLYPHFEIHVLSLNANRAILEDHPAVNKFIGVSSRSGFELLKTFWSLRKNHYDLVLAFHANTSLCRWLFLVRGKEKIAHHHSWNYTPKVSDRKLANPGAHQNAIEKDYEILRALGWEGAPLPTSLSVSSEAGRAAEEKLRAIGLMGAKERLVILPGAAEALRRYPKEMLEETIRQLKAGGKYEIAILADRPLIEEWKIGEWAKVLGVGFVDGLSLKEFIAMISRFQVAIANDSGPGHIAAALGLKTVHIFGKGSIGDFYPYDLVTHGYVRADVDCRIHGPRTLERFQFCTVETCSHLSCLRKIPPANLTQATLELSR